MKNLTLTRMRILTVILCSIAIINVHGQTSGSLLQVDEKAAKAASTTNHTEIPQPNVQKATNENASPKKNAFASEANKDAQVAKWNGGSLTTGEVKKILERRRPKALAAFPGTSIEHVDEKVQKEIVKELAYELIMYKEALKADKNISTVKAKIQEGRDKILAFAYYESVIEPELKKLEDEVAREYYEKNKETEFLKPENKVYQIVHAPANEVIIVKDEESPRDVTRRVFGSDKKVDSINIYPVPFYSKPNEIRLEDSALSAPLPLNTKVQFPPTEDEMTSAAKKIKQASDLIKSGKSVDELKELGLELSPEFVQLDESWITNYSEPLKNLSDNTTISMEIRTSVGYDLLLTVKSIPASYIPYEEVKEICLHKAIVSDVQKKNKIEDIRSSKLKSLVAQSNLTVNNDLLEKGSISDISDLSTEWIVKGEGFNYPLELFLKDIRVTGKDWGILNSQERKDLAVSNPHVVRFLTVNEAIRNGLDKKPEFQDQLDSLEVIETVNAYLDNLRSEEMTSDSLQADIREYYDKNLSRYTHPAQITYREISKRINMADSPLNKSKQIDQAKTVLAEIRSRAKTSEQFAEIARKESESISTRIYGGLVGPVADNAKGNVFKNQIDMLKPGETSQPFLYGSEMVIIRLEERTAPTAQPFESVKNQVFADYKKVVPAEKEKKRMESTLEKKNFQLLF